CYEVLPHLLSFPTRRSSDLDRQRVNEALIEDTQHDIDSEYRQRQQQAKAAHRALEGLRGALKTRCYRVGQIDLFLHGIDRGNGLDRKSIRLNSSHVKISYAV